MEALFAQYEDVYVVQLKGQLDFETADALKTRCSAMFNKQKVIFNLGRLSFVGSSGITPFLELLAELLRSNGNSLKVCSVSNEFIRIFEAGGLMGLEVYENEQQARLAFKYPPFVQAQSASHTAPEAPALARISELGIDVDIES